MLAFNINQICLEYENIFYDTFMNSYKFFQTNVFC